MRLRPGSILTGAALLLGMVAAGVALSRIARAATTGLREYRARREQLAETEALLASLPVLEDSAKVLRVRVGDLAPRILAGHTAAEAVAALSAQLSLLANRQGTRIETVRASPDTTPRTGLVRVGVTVVVHTDAAGLARWLGAIATHPATLVAQRLRVDASGGFGSPSDMETLQVELVVTGWYLPRVAKS